MVAPLSKKPSKKEKRKAKKKGIVEEEPTSLEDDVHAIGADENA